MSTGGHGPEGDRDDPEPRIAQWGTATRGGRVMQAGRNQYILNLGNAVWVTAPVVVAVAVVLVLYLTVGRASGVSGPPSLASAASQTPKSPVTVTLAYDQNHVVNGAGPCMNWMFSRPVSAIPAATDVIDETWAHRLGGVDMRVTDFKLAVQGVTTTAVQLLGFRVIDVERGPALRGTDVISTDGCGPAPEAGFDIALGRNPPVIAPVSGLDSRAAKKIPFPFVVSSTDIQQFQVEAVDSLSPGTSSCNCDVKWRLALDWSYEGKTGTTVIDDNGQPFQTFFPPPVTSWPLWVDENGAWKRV
jgi:hypothetical protein